MRITPLQSKIALYQDGFEKHDLLNRKVIGGQLTDLVTKVEEPLVVAIDGAWGSGKSFFLKCWVGELAKSAQDTATIVYFDAFENDYLDDPFVSLTSMLAERLKGADDQGKLSSKAAAGLKKILAPAARIAIAAATTGVSEILAPILSGALGAAGSEANEQIEKLWNVEASRRQAMSDFRASLEALAELDDEGKPTKRVIFVVDELDRCRPDYALQTLEVMKHFFSVAGVHFVLGANLEELMNSVRARYGDRVDARTYLEKFVSVSMRLPEAIDQPGRSRPAATVYFREMSTRMALPEKIVEGVIRWQDNFDGLQFRSIRQSQKVLTEIALIPNKDNVLDRLYFGWNQTLTALILLKHLEPDRFNRLRRNKLSYREMAEFLDLDRAGSEDLRETKLAQYIWRCILAPDLVVDEDGLRNVWGGWGRERLGELIPTLLRDYIDPIVVVEELLSPKP